MSAFCDRCGSALERPGLCPPCRAALPAAPPGGGARGGGMVLALLLAVGLSGWLAWRVRHLELRLKSLEGKRIQEPAPALAEALPEPEPPPEEAIQAPAPPPLRVASLPVLPAPPPVQPALEPPPPLPRATAAPVPPPELASVDPLVRYRALEVLEDPAHAVSARALLTDEMGFVRRAAASALGRLRDASAKIALERMVEREGDLAARVEGLRALGLIAASVDDAP